MGRKNFIEGQMSLFDLPVIEPEVLKEKTEEIVQEKPVKKKAVKEKSVKAGKFPECANCWCYTCEHSSVGGSVPRTFVNGEHPCPSCEFCVTDGKADMCVIGSAKDGCAYRAKKEGLLQEDA